MNETLKTQIESVDTHSGVYHAKKLKRLAEAELERISSMEVPTWTDALHYLLWECSPYPFKYAGTPKEVATSHLRDIIADLRPVS